METAARKTVRGLIPERFLRLVQIVGGLLLLHLASGAFNVFRTATGPARGQAATRGGFVKGAATKTLSPGLYRVRRGVSGL